LAALSNLFDVPWIGIVAGFRESSKGIILNAVGWDLSALGRLDESAQPMQAALHAAIAREDWKNAAIAAGNLSQIYLSIGDVVQALAYAKQSMELADQSARWQDQVSSGTALADALHQAGRLAEAEAAFCHAEQVQKKNQPKFPTLYSVQGFLYCDLLLSQGKYQEVRQRADQSLQWVTKQGWLLDIGLDNVSLGRACLVQALGEGTDDYCQAETYLDRAVEGLRRAGHQGFIIRGLLARSVLWRITSAPEKARRDLDEAFAICTRCGMRLYEADWHLEYARWYLASGEKPKAVESLEKARKMIEEMGYHRRDTEVKELEAQLGDE
jgi:tetratricopeptide (TPR) repeat protein